MKAVDSSVVIATFASWHEAHDAARRLLHDEVRIPAHAAFEVYSVLTRLPPPHRAPASQVRAFLDAEFPAPWLVLPAPAQAALLGRLVELGITGGATYDALIAETARHSGAVLHTCDRRAMSVFDRLGVEARLIA